MLQKHFSGPTDLKGLVFSFKVLILVLFLIGNAVLYLRVTRRMKNYGLASQWYFAWAPEDENEVAFIFEDDVEVLEYSPLNIYSFRRFYFGPSRCPHISLHGLHKSRRSIMSLLCPIKGRFTDICYKQYVNTLSSMVRSASTVLSNPGQTWNHLPQSSLVTLFYMVSAFRNKTSTLRTTPKNSNCIPGIDRSYTGR